MSSRFSYSLTVFSTSGKLLQIENALAAVSAGRPTIGMIANNGVVIVSEKLLPSLLYDESAVSKIEKICDHIGISYSGMSADFRLLVVHARKIAATYKLKYGEYPTPLYMAQEVASVMQEYTQQNGGTYFKWKATAIGKNSANCKTFIKKRYNSSTSLDIEEENFEGVMKENNIQVAICDASGFRQVPPSKVKDYVDATSI